MKTRLLCLSILPLTMHYSYGQKNTVLEATTYNFETKDAIIINPVTHGQTSIFRIENINRFLYEVEIKTKQGEYNSEVPVALKILMPETENNTNANIKAQETFSQEASEILSAAENQLALLKDERKMKNDEKTLTAGSKKAKLAKSILSLDESIAKQTKEIERLNTIATNVDNLIQEVKIIQKSFEQLEEIKSLKNVLIQISNREDLTYAKAISETDKYTDELFSYRASIGDFNNGYLRFIAAYQQFSDNKAVQANFNEGQAKINADLDPLFNEVKSLKEIVDKTKYDDILNETKTLYDQLRNANNYMAVSAPVQAEKDEINFTVKIEPRKSATSSLNLENTEFTFRTPIKGGVKIDFSTGLFYTRNLYNRSYYLTSSESDSLKSRINQSRNNSYGQVSIGALMHISPRSTAIFKPGLCLGVSLNSTNITDANFFIGGSLIIGSRERFIISGGFSVAPIDYLKGRYDLDHEYTTADLDEGSLTEKTMKGSGFISFTYNLTSKPKE